MDLNCFKAVVTKHYDGDTPTLDFDFGCGVHWIGRVRMAGINAPELNSTDPATKAKAVAALNYLESLIPVGANVIVQSFIDDNYGRRLGTIWVNNGDQKSVNQMMLDSGNAVVMTLATQIKKIQEGKLI